MRQAEECKVRQVIDAAAALALGVGPEVLADWRRGLAAEPTITNERAPSKNSYERPDNMGVS